MDDNKVKMLKIAKILHGTETLEGIGILETVKNGILQIAAKEANKILLNLKEPEWE